MQGLSEDRLYGWTTEGLVRPTLEAGEVYYQEVDVARLRLLVTLEDDLEVDSCRDVDAVAAAVFVRRVVVT